ncbi:MAG: polysaccharide deacetylase family protein [Candidatus Krumholzibacteriia bacterium]
MKRRLKTILLALPGFERACRALTRGHVRALMYHRFSDRTTGDPRFVDRGTLAAQGDLIARHHARWTPDEHLATVTGGPRPAGRCPVVVTADDGYHDFHDVAFGVFRRAGIPAMLFVTTGFVDGSHWFWWDRLEHVLHQAPAGAPAVDVGGRRLDLDLTSPRGRRAAWHQVADRCRFLPDRQKEEAVARLAADLGVALPAAPPAPYRPVTWEQIAAMAEAGLPMGAHTVSHPILSRVGEDEAAREIRASVERLAARLDRPVRWFAYPQGGPADWTPAVRDAVAAVCAGCYLAYQDLARADDPFTLPRYCVTADMVDFRWMLCGAEHLFLRLRRLLGRPTGVGAGYWAGADPSGENP